MSKATFRTKPTTDSATLPAIDWDALAAQRQAGHGGLQGIIDARQFPGAKVASGNDTFFQHRHNNEDLNNLPPVLRDKLLEHAKAAGVDIGGKVYIDGLARYPNDPLGWCSSTEEAQAKAQAQGKHLHGAIAFAPDPRKVTAPPEF